MRSFNSGVKSIKVIVIFPAKNEESTIENTVSMALESSFYPEIVVVDAYSRDSGISDQSRCNDDPTTRTDFSWTGHGIKKAVERSADIILFLDANIENLFSSVN